MENLLQFIANGFMVGGVYSLIALSIVIVYKATAIFNFAMGEFMLVGAFVCWAIVVMTPLPPWLGIIVALAVSVLLGLLVERVVLRPMLGQTILSQVMATIGLSVVLTGIVAFIWGPSTVAYPGGLLPKGALRLEGVATFSYDLLWPFLIAVVIFAGLVWFFQRSSMGLRMRGVAEDHQLAQATGIDVSQVFAITWAIAAMVLGLCGILIGNRVGIGRGLTPQVGLKAFPAVLFGGLESIPGALIGGLVVGLLENLAAGLIDPKVGEITPYVILLLVLMFRPQGLFGLKRIERI